MNPLIEPAPCQPGVCNVSAEMKRSDGTHTPLPDAVVVREEALTVDIEAVGRYVLMWSPTTNPTGAVGYTAEDGVLSERGIPEALALAAGFAFTEGIVEGLADIVAMWICSDRPDVVNIRLAHPERTSVLRRNVVINSSCGICGGYEQVLRAAGSVRRSDDLRVGVADLARVREQLTAQQRIFGQTGGTHCAALFDAGNTCPTYAEDIGRHNALDKVIGCRLLSGLPFTGCGVFLSSRASYEMTAKAARAGLELLAAISAPTSLAIELALRQDLTLCGFVRGDRATVYSHGRRIASVNLDGCRVNPDEMEDARPVG